MKVVRRQDPFLGPGIAGKNVPPLNAGQNAAFDRRRQQPPPHLHKNVVQRGFRHFPAPIQEYGIVAPGFAP